MASRLLPALLTVALVLPAASADAQSNCALRETVVGKLADRYGERQVGAGVQSSANMFEVWASEEKGTWTILMTRSDGVACIMASGTSWQGERPPSRPRPNL